MLKKFEVENYMGFTDKLVFDLSKVYDYDFNQSYIKNNIVNKALIFGKNGVGKSNLGMAIFDITSHLKDDKSNNSLLFNPDSIYVNGNLPAGTTAYFKYYFVFGDDEIIYEYEKYSIDTFKKEVLYINNKKVVSFDHIDKNKNFVLLDECQNLNLSLLKKQMSVIRYIYYNSNLSENNLIVKMIDFVNRMLFFSTSSTSHYDGLINQSKFLTESLTKVGNLNKFSNFLKENGLNFDLSIEENPLDNTKVIMANYKYKKVPLHLITSDGTDALILYFCWSLNFSNLSFLYLDEFDSHYHYETSERILNLINKETSFQAILTTHNTTLMKNNLTRPDCCYVLSNGKINSLSTSTEKEIREAHNLEKMYRNGAF